MSTLPTAIDALKTVARAHFLANTGDATYGTLYANMLWYTVWPWDEGLQYAYPATYLYNLTGDVQQQGLGSAKMWRHPRLRLETFANQAADANQMMEQIRAAWLTDFNTSPAVNAAGTGYLRLTGGIKWIEIGEHRSADWEKRGIVFRRLCDVMIEIGD